MSIYDSVWKEKAETFQRERDEARSFAAHYVKSLTDEAEARGYRKGVEDAANVATEHYQSMCREHRLLLVNRATAILALLEQTSDTPITLQKPEA